MLMWSERQKDVINREIESTSSNQNAGALVLMVVDNGIVSLVINERGMTVGDGFSDCICQAKMCRTEADTFVLSLCRLIRVCKLTLAGEDPESARLAAGRFGGNYVQTMTVVNSIAASVSP